MFHVICYIVYYNISMLKIVTAPNTVLSTSAKKVEGFDQSLHQIIRDMEQTLLAQSDPKTGLIGVGLAAPQVGINVAIFLMKHSKRAKIQSLINPKILKFDYTFKPDRGSDADIKNTSLEVRKMAKKEKTRLEGCLSIPKVWAPVKRAKKVLLEYQDINGSLHKRWFTGFQAVIVQHETDHLNGVLFTQRALEQKATLYEEKDGKLTKMDY